MGSADSKLNFREGGDPAHHQDAGAPGAPAFPPTCRAGGFQARISVGNGCKNLASRGLGGPAGQEVTPQPGPGRDPGPVPQGSIP